MDFWADVFSSWDAFVTFVLVVILFYGGLWILSKIGGRLSAALNNDKKPIYKYKLSDSNAPAKPSDPIITKAVGVTFNDRQVAIRSLRVNEGLELVPEPDNPHDPHAIKVTKDSGEQIGYINQELAKNISWFFQASIFPRPAKVLEIIGDEHKGQSLGVIIEIYPPSLEEALVSSDFQYPVPPF